jgi:hypothetical protein
MRVGMHAGPHMAVGLDCLPGEFDNELNSTVDEFCSAFHVF